MEDDLGTEHFESGDWGGGVRVFPLGLRLRSAPPPRARLLRVTVDGESVELDLMPDAPFVNRMDGARSELRTGKVRRRSPAVTITVQP